MGPFINQLMSTRDYRQWLICNEIDQRKQATVQELLELCACTLKTLLVDIQGINDRYSSIERMPKLKKKKILFI